MTDDMTKNVVFLLANDAMEAAGNQGSRAAVSLLDAVVTVLATCHKSEGARREMAGLLAEYIVGTVDALIASEAGHG